MLLEPTQSHMQDSIQPSVCGPHINVALTSPSPGHHLLLL